MLYVHLLLLDHYDLRQNERNSSLIDGLESTPEDPLIGLRVKVDEMCRDTTIEDAKISTFALSTAYTHATQFGHLAEFWLLLSVLEAVSHPLETYGHHQAGPFREKAKDCTDASSELFRAHGLLVVELLRLRAGSSNQRVHVAAKFAQQPYALLAKMTEHVH
jgi:hypothetical protein